MRAAVRAGVRRVLRGGARAIQGCPLPAVVQRAALDWRYPDGPARLVPSPVFLLSPVRSGSTLLRVLLDSHSMICAPHEMHLNPLRVTAPESYLRKSLKELGLSTGELENLLWDRVMHRQLVTSRKSVLVDKTPQNLALWRRLDRSWPDARYLFLLRHPAAVARSLGEARPDLPPAQHRDRVLQYANQLNEARAHLPGLTVRYEDLVADPERVTREVCAWIGVRWESQMLDYGKTPHGRYARGLGDWSDKIRSGRVQPARPLPAPEEVPEQLRAVATAWGY